MAHQDFGQICPIFKEGVEHEMVAPVVLSHTCTTYPVFAWRPGREVVIQEAFLQYNQSTGMTTAYSLTLNFYKNESTCIGSISGATASFSDTLGVVLLSGSMTSTAFTSTDVLTAYFLEAAGACKAAGNSLIIRYRDK